MLYLGVSEWSVEQIQAWLNISDRTGAARPISNQPEYSMLWRVPEQEIMPFGKGNGMSQIVWSPLAQGVLTGKYAPGVPAPAGSRASFTTAQGVMGRYMRDDILTAVQRLKPIAADVDLTPAQLAVAWVLANQNVSAAIVGASRPEHLAENIKGLATELTEDLLAQVDTVLEGVSERN